MESKILDTYKIEGTINLDQHSCFNNPNTFPQFQAGLNHFKYHFDEQFFKFRISSNDFSYNCLSHNKKQILIYNATMYLILYDIHKKTFIKTINLRKLKILKNVSTPRNISIFLIFLNLLKL